MTAPMSADELTIILRPSPPSLRAVITINGLDLLAHRASRRPDGSSGLVSVRPWGLLPPGSPRLLPTVTPQQVMVGVCGSDGEPGCASLWVQVRRDGDRVQWEPDPRSPRRTIACTWSFALLPYLEAVDRATVELLDQETRVDRVARELRRRRDSLFGFGMNSRTEIFELQDARSGWTRDDGPRTEQLVVTVAGSTGQVSYGVPVPPGSTDDDILLPLHLFEPRKYEELFRNPWVRRAPLPPRTG